MPEYIGLNLACGPNFSFSKGGQWINLDLEDMREYITFLKVQDMLTLAEGQRKLKKKLLEGYTIHFHQSDVLEGLKFDNTTVDYIFCSHFLEHLNPVYEANAFLRECHRVLMPGGLIRIAVPDLDIILKHYLKKNMKFFDKTQPRLYMESSESMKLGYLLFGSMGEGSTRKNYEGHMMAYNFQSLKQLLEVNAFVDTRKMAFGMSQSSIIEDTCFDTWPEGSIYVEATK